MVCLDILVWVMTVYAGFCLNVLVIFLEILMILGVLWYLRQFFLLRELWRY